MYVCQFLNILPFCRYPVILERFHLKEGTGGNGLFRGGDGVLRKILFRKTVTLSVLTERRVFAPYGLEGYFFLSVFYNNFKF